MEKIIVPAQQAAIKAIVEAATVPGGTTVLALIGYAGTGKSYCIGEVRAQLEGLGIYPLTIAPTNAAVNVLKEAGIEGATTCHSALRLTPKRTASGELSFKRRPARGGELEVFEGLQVLIVDESSMLDPELVDLILADARKQAVRLVLFVGDDAQLPPVSGDGSVSPALTTEPHQILRLTEVMRGRGKCDAPALAQVVRDNIERSEVTLPRELLERYDQGDLCGVNVVREGTDEAWMPGGKSMRVSTRVLLAALRYQAHVWSKAGEAGVSAQENAELTPYAVAYRNKTVLEIIRDVRRELTGSEIPFVGEEMVFSEPLVEGIGKDERVVYNVGDRISAVYVSSVKTCEHSDLQYILISDGQLLNDGSQRMMKVARDPAEWLDLKSECWKLRKELEGVAPGHRTSEQVRHLQAVKACQEELRQIVDLRGVWATTAHKAQGSTHGVTVVDLHDIGLSSTTRGAFKTQQELHAARVLAEQTYNRMLYVALTRPKSELVLVV